MGASDVLLGILRWFVHAFISIAISLVVLAGTLVAAYWDFGQGMAIFWAGCILTAAHGGYRMWGMRCGVGRPARVYAGSLLSLAVNVVLGYGGAYVIYVYGNWVRASDPLMAALLPARAPAVFALTAAAYASLMILLAVARAVLAFGFSRSACRPQAPAQRPRRPRSRPPR